MSEIILTTQTLKATAKMTILTCRTVFNKGVTDLYVYRVLMESHQ